MSHVAPGPLRGAFDADNPRYPDIVVDFYSIDRRPFMIMAAVERALRAGGVGTRQRTKYVRQSFACKSADAVLAVALAWVAAQPPEEGS